MLSEIAVPSRVIRTASHSGTRPPWRGRSAVPDRFINLNSNSGTGYTTTICSVKYLPESRGDGAFGPPRVEGAIGGCVACPRNSKLLPNGRRQATVHNH